MLVKKITKKLITVGVSITLLASIMTGCGSSSSTAVTDVSKLKPVTLKMYLIGDKPKDFDAVYSKVNAIMKKKINATLSVSFMSFADIGNKYSLLFQSGQNFDLIFTAAGWGYYNQVATKNGFCEITEDMLKKYAPNVYASQPKDAWEQAKVNGKIYMVPQDKKELSYDVYGVRGDLMKKYGINKINSYADMQKYLEAAAKDKTLKYPIANGGSQGLGIDWATGSIKYCAVRGATGQISFVTDDASGKLVSVVDTQDYLTYLKKMKQFAADGLWASDAISSKATKDDDFVAGNSAVMIWNVGTVANREKKMKAAHPDWDPQIVDLSSGSKKLIAPYINSGMAISATSKNPERSLMAINLMRSNEQIYNLMQYGIKGTHWKPVGKDKYETLPKTNDYPAENVCPWGFTTKKLTDSNQPAIVDQIQNKWLKNDVINNPMAAFTFDDSNVKNEVTQVSNVINEYGLPLELGMVKDVDAGYKQYREKLKQAGYDTILAECQKQATAYVKSHKSK